MKQHFLTDAKGKKQAVVLDMDTYERLMEDFADLTVVAERKKNFKYPPTEFVLRLKKHGVL